MTSVEDDNGKGKIPIWRSKIFGYFSLPLLLLLVIFHVNTSSEKEKDHYVCHDECSARRNQRYEYFNERDILNVNHLLNQVADEAKILIAKLNVDYGEENFKQIFMTDDGKVRPFLPIGGKSTDRLERKLMIKVLSAQTNLMQKESEFNGCDCTNGDVGISSNPVMEVEHMSKEDGEYLVPPLETIFEKYVWATGGHSASAGHGNLFNESYTAFMENDLKNVFGSIGIDFQGRNYAMGGIGSAAEIAMCWEEIFGDDVDFFSWDYGMTDAGRPVRLLHYAYRGALSAGRPAFMGIRVNLDRGSQNEMIELLGKNGVPIFVEDNNLWTIMRQGIPDTVGLSSDEIDAMPEYVRNFKCDGVIEKGEPFCLIEKYSTDVCPDRQGKAPWHPGIKTHAMVGHSLALFLIDNLLAALQKLNELEYEDVETLLSRLKKEEFEDRVKKIDFGEYATKLYSIDDSEDKDGIDFDPNIFFTDKSMCHTAQLPAQIRYMGYLTNTEKIGGPASFGNETFDVGIEEKEALMNSDTMQLVWTDDKMHQDDCPVAVNIDHKDSFFSTGDGWNTLSFPNEAERKAYNYNTKALHGIVVLIFTPCEWDRCDEGYIDQKDFNGDSKKWEMKINGVPVQRLVNIGNKAFIAKSNDGIKFPPSPDEDYKFEIKLNDPSQHVKISSFIVY
eukprot:CAMPEP_0197183210 /NCGR_PEP_ID=MMETSP1423-20130617/7663_1 /TAXON_ID=476441 /ORGANISM="Pseudo-nitzschia heimii, Strain UNC1101" /LENGTH=670 /DNA_ID=CAMNT_0042633773 /DNA_START=138 /DNA_END=2150 /DNA_ORIENTATION=+